MLCKKQEIHFRARLALSYRGADKSLARPARKKATATKLELFQATQIKKSEIVRPAKSPRQQLPPCRTKNGDLSIVFQSVRAKDLSAPLYLLHAAESFLRS